jgi:hypothetical protein
MNSERLKLTRPSGDQSSHFLLHGPAFGWWSVDRYAIDGVGPHASDWGSNQAQHKAERGTACNGVHEERGVPRCAVVGASSRTAALPIRNLRNEARLPN